MLPGLGQVAHVPFTSGLGFAGLRWCLANSSWLSLRTRMEREEGEVGGGLGCFEKAELCFYP